MSKIIVGIDGSRAFTDKRTGTENYSYQLLCHLAQLEAKLPAAERTNYLIYLRPGNQVNQAEWPANFQFKMLDYPLLWTQVGLAWATFSDKIDLLFVPSHTLPLIRRFGLKTIMTVHDLGAEYLPASHQLKQRLYLGLMTHFQMKTATELIAVSTATKQDIIKRVGVAPERIEVIFEGLNPLSEIKSDIVRNVLKQYDLVHGRYFLFVGTVQPRKNISRLIEAFKLFQANEKNNQYKLVIAGGYGWDYQPILDLPKQLGIDSRVVFTERVDDQALSALYQGAAGLAYPSLFEGFGLPILEAYSVGIPVLTSNNSSLPEVAGQGAILVDPTSVPQITDGLYQLLDPTIRTKLITAGRQQLKLYTWAKAASQTRELLIKLASTN